MTYLYALEQNILPAVSAITSGQPNSNLENKAITYVAIDDLPSTTPRLGAEDKIVE